MVLATREDPAAPTRSTRSGSRRARPTTSRRRGSRSRRAAAPTRSARPSSRSSPGARRWARSRSTRGRCARDDVDHPDELRLDLDPQPGTDFADAVRVAAVGARAARRARLRRLPEDLGRPRHPRLRAHRAALDLHRRAPRRDRVRPGAGAAPARRGHDASGGRRSAASASSSTTTRTPATGRSPPPTASARSPAPRCRRRSRWDELARRRSPRTSRSRRCPPASRRSATRTPRSTTSRTRCSRCSTCTSATSRARRHAVPARLPEDARRAEARPAVTRPRPARLRRYGACGSFFAPGGAGLDGGGTTGPMSPSGASSRSTITGAWSLGPLPLRAWRSTHAALRARRRRRSRARGRSACRSPGGTCPAR